MAQAIQSFLHDEIFETLARVLPVDALRAAVLADESARLTQTGIPAEDVEASISALELNLDRLSFDALVELAYEICITNDAMDAGTGRVYIDRDRRVSVNPRDLYRQYLINSCVSVFESVGKSRLGLTARREITDQLDKLKGAITVSVRVTGSDLVIRLNRESRGATVQLGSDELRADELKASFMQYLDNYIHFESKGKAHDVTIGVSA
ncbi:hypothetical protein ACYPKM_03510 [Pseudomonas aeruginosa]